MNFASQMLLQVTLDVCGSMLGLSQVRVLEQPELAYREECLEGSVRITGDWEIELRVVCPRTLAMWMAAEMYDIVTHDLSDQNIWDALREVISLIGSDIKDALGGKNSLSYPRIRENILPFDADLPPGVSDFPGDVFTVHLADTTHDAVLAS